MTVKIYNCVDSIDSKIWGLLNDSKNPFLNYDFFSTLEKSQCVGIDSGWMPRYLTSLDGEKKGILYFFEKKNSLGEYIFDWEWVDAYHRNDLPYFPKITSMVPFTPVTNSHFIMDKFDEDLAHQLLDTLEQYYSEHNFSSLHFLFLSPEERTLFTKRGYLIRESFQYHFFNNNYENFAHMLTTFKGKKAKTILKERSATNELQINSITGDNLTADHAKQMFKFYQNTIAQKGAISYLNEQFFCDIFEKLKHNILYVEAFHENRPIAGALYFYDANKLYGRYWGSTEDYPFLHFELCYYRGIDFLLEKNLKVFEAGAQGEHKISRGFKPIRTYSAHLIKNETFNVAISDFIVREKESVGKTIQYLNKMIPFKSESKQ
ncbi:GNAT family N-acetyltransferase [Bacteriovoracaceae bacterium]|nr:GNAT family N-acetyltransferase [Bacteriovoracaceae bacterium]